MKNKKTLILSIVAVLSLVCITVGISLAFFNYAGKGTTDNTLETGSITFLYTETSNAGRGIAITDAFPISDSEGKTLTGEGNVFDFNISSSKSGHNKRIDYEITARKSDDSTLDEDVVVMYLTKVNGIEEKEILLDKYSNLADTEKVSGYNEKTLYKTAVYVADDSYNQDYKLRMWITNDGTFEQEDMGKTFKVNVNVYADAKVVEQGQIAFENNTLIDNLKVGNSTINPVENEDYKYDAILPYDTTEANIIIETVNPNATVDIKNVTSNYAYTNIISKVSTTRKLEGLVNGDNYFDITIASENGKVEDEYILKVEVKDITPPELDVTNTEKSLNSITLTYDTSDSDTGIKEVVCEYGSTKEYGNSVVCSNGKCVINGLGLGTEYYYRIISRNISGTEKIIENSIKTDSCTAGYYGANGTSSCSKCPTGYTSDVGSQNINSCYISLTKGQGKTETGLATTCSTGTYMSDAVSKAYYGTAYNCTTCEAGYYCTGGSARSACSGLGSGYTSAAGASACYRITQLGSAILADNTLVTSAPTLTTTSSEANENGLYKSTDTNTGEPTYYFRGNVENNYVSFAGMTWRIVRINEDGTIRLILQDGINRNTRHLFNTTAEAYKYMYYTNSDTIKPTVDSWYQANLSSYSDKIATGNYFCEQAKVKNSSSSFLSGFATMAVYTDYTPDFKCSTDRNGKGIVNSNIGLITYDEMVYAGGYYDKSNNAYYLKNGTLYWSMSPAGISYGSAKVWVINHSGSIDYTGVYDNDDVHPVINLKSTVTVKGFGTSSDPYVVQ